MFKTVKSCNNTEDFRKLAKKRLPSPIFHYIDGAADDEITLKRNTEAYENCDLVPNVLVGVDKVDLSTEIFGKKIDLPFFAHQLHYKDFSTMMGNLLSVRQRKNLILFSGFLLLVLLA